MSGMAKKLPTTDVVVVGLGWAGSIIAKELADEGLRVVGFERGAWRDTASDFNIASVADELRYVARQELMLRTRQNTCTLRNKPSETAATRSRAHARGNTPIHRPSRPSPPRCSPKRRATWATSRSRCPPHWPPRATPTSTA